MEDRELLEALRQRLTLANDDGGVRRLTLGKVYTLFKLSRPRGRAWQLERNLLRPFVVRYWRRPASSLTGGDWEAHRRERRKQRTRLGRPPCELSLNLELGRAKQMLAWAVDSGHLKSHPLRHCKRVKTRTRRESWFTAEQITQLIDAADSLRWDHQQRTFRALASVMADTGLRISEALSLRWDRLTLRGVTSVVGKGTKTRVIALTPRALAAVSKLDRHQGSPRIFVNFKTWKAWNASTVRSWFRQCIEAARLEGVKADGDLALVPHCLRHSAASIADERGAPATMIQAMLGHSSLKTTENYLHRSKGDAALRMAAIMSGRRPAKSATRRSPSVNAFKAIASVKLS